MPIVLSFCVIGKNITQVITFLLCGYMEMEKTQQKRNINEKHILEIAIKKSTTSFPQLSHTCIFCAM